MGTEAKNKRQQLSNTGSMMSSDNQDALFLLELYLPKPLSLWAVCPWRLW